MERLPVGLQTFVEMMDEGVTHAALDTNQLPLWITGITRRAFSVKTPGALHTLTFIEPAPDVPFDRILALIEGVRKQLKTQPVIIADNLNPHFRPLFVRERVPFVSGTSNIFAPNLGIKLSGLSALHRMYPDRRADEISPLGIKIIAGALTGFISTHRLKVNEIVGMIQRSGGKGAPSKVSATLRELKNLGLVKERDRGPLKYYETQDKQTLFQDFLRLPHARLFKRITHITPPEMGYVWAGETALAKYTNLGEPKRKTIAIHRRESWDWGTSPQESLLRPGEEVEIELWKEDPNLFEVDGKINPIELYLSIKPLLDDSRVQIEIADLLGRYDLGITPV